MKDARVLITGGAGFIGSHIADLLVQEDVAEIRVLDNFVRGRRENLATALGCGKVTIVEGDIRDAPLVREVMDGIDVLFHQAAIRITQCAEEPRLAVEVMVDGTFTVLEAAVAARVGKSVAASSASVYGLAEEFPTPERHHANNNRTLYGAAKLFNEGLLRSFNEMYDLNYIALRYFNVYGPRMDVRGAYTDVLIRWIERLANGQAPIIMGDGLQTMDVVYVEDVARASVLAAKAAVTDEVFNVASGRETSLRELAQALMASMGVSVPLEFGPARKVNSVSRRLGDTSAARDGIGFVATVSLAEGLRQLVTWWQAERALLQR